MKLVMKTMTQILSKILDIDAVKQKKEISKLP